MEDNDDSITEPPPAKRMLRSQVDAFDINKCAICQQHKTKLTKNKGARSREPLSLNKTATGSASLLKAAEIRDDRRLLLQLQGKDTIAIGIKYHKSCYVQYVRPGALAKLEEKNCEDEDIASESYNRAFSSIREFVKDAVLKGEKAVKISELLERFVSKVIRRRSVCTQLQVLKVEKSFNQVFREQTLVPPASGSIPIRDNLQFPRDNRRSRRNHCKY